MGRVLDALLKNESGGRNIPNVHQGTSSGQAQGHFQITTGTWDEFGGRQYAPDALHATPEQQAAIAAKIPLKRWDKSTLRVMQAAGGRLDPNKTLEENLAMNSETLTGYAGGMGTAPAGTGRYDPRSDSPSYARPTGEKVEQYATEHPAGPSGDVVTTASPYTLPAPGTGQNPLVTTPYKNPFEAAGAAIGKFGAQGARSTLGAMQNAPNPPLTSLPAMPSIDPASATTQRNALVTALMRLNSGQLFPPMSGSGGGGIG